MFKGKERDEGDVREGMERGAVGKEGRNVTGKQKGEGD